MTTSQTVPATSAPTPTNPSAPRRLATKEIGRKELINALNHANFKGETVSLMFAERATGTSRFIEASPMPVLSDYPVFRFLEPMPTGLEATRLCHLIIPEGPGHIEVVPRLLAQNGKGVSIVLPETGLRVQGPPRDTLTAAGIRVHFHLKGLRLKGSLELLRHDGFEVRLSPLSARYLSAIKPEKTLRLTFSRDKTPLFETEARVTGEDIREGDTTLRFSPVEPDATRRDTGAFGKKSFPMTPAPDLLFTHPLTLTRHTIVIDSLSAIGLSFTLPEDPLPLLPGMLLEDAAIVLGDLYNLPFTGRVTRCTTAANEKGKMITHGTLDFVDMNPETHRKIQSMVHKAENRDVRISAPVDDGDLWRFFFETGFIYKNKYKLFLDNKEKIKRTYHALYSAPTEVTRHVTYHEKGRTMGHASMLRYAERAWLFHHHAALKGASIKVGLGILNHMNHYLYDSLWLDKAGIDYLLLYFRPENGFPNFVFNGFAEKMGNPKACSVDLFAYRYFRRASGAPRNMPAGWTLEAATHQDITALETRYEATSGGLLLDALDLFERKAPAEDLSRRYQKAGLRKERTLWAVRHNNQTAAMVIVNTSDVALNMSELTNCMKVCVTQPDLLTGDVLTHALNHLSRAFDTPTMPVLVHPFSWVEKSGFPFRKRYLFWAFNTEYSDHYMQYFSDLLAIATQPKKPI